MEHQHRNSNTNGTVTVEGHLEAARTAIAVEDDELHEARRRRDLAADALRAEFPGCRIVPNGSLAHGDANTPLTDWDLVVVVPDPDADYGPGRKNADTLKQRAKRALRHALADEFPNLTVMLNGQKRSVLVRFSEPVTPGTTDFTGDVICAVDHPEKGLYIPRYNTWDRSHPEEHNRILRDANAATSSRVAQAVRLIKHWNNCHSEPLCSWHIKVLAVEAIRRHVPMADALLAFFEHAANSIDAGDTPDPADVGPDITPNISRTETVKRLRTARDHVADAVDADDDGRPLRAQYHLSCVLPHIVDAPDPGALDAEDARHASETVGRGRSVGASPTLHLPRTRSWADG